jgi:hypothetical protein
VETSVGYAEIVLRLTEVERAHRGPQPGGTRGRAERLGELLSDEGVLGGRGNQVQHALPHLVEAIDPRPVAAREQRLELGWTRSENDSCRV